MDKVAKVLGHAKAKQSTTLMQQTVNYLESIDKKMSALIDKAHGIKAPDPKSPTSPKLNLEKTQLEVLSTLKGYFVNQ